MIAFSLSLCSAIGSRMLSSPTGSEQATLVGKAKPVFFRAIEAASSEVVSTRHRSLINNTRRQLDKVQSLHVSEVFVRDQVMPAVFVLVDEIAESVRVVDGRLREESLRGS